MQKTAQPKFEMHAVKCRILIRKAQCVDLNLHKTCIISPSPKEKKINKKQDRKVGAVKLEC